MASWLHLHVAGNGLPFSKNEKGVRHFTAISGFDQSIPFDPTRAQIHKHQCRCYLSQCGFRQLFGTEKKKIAQNMTYVVAILMLTRMLMHKHKNNRKSMNCWN